MKLSKKIIGFCIGVFFCILGSALEIKASIGTGAFNAFAISMSSLLSTQIGNICMAINVVCMLLQLTIKRQKLSVWGRQIFFLVFAGILLNFFVYTILGRVVLPNYLTRLAVLVSSSVIGAFGVVFILESNLITLPLEGFRAMLSERFKRSTGFYRQMADVLFITATLLITLLGRMDLSIREGTVIGALLFGPSINLWRRLVRKMLGIKNTGSQFINEADHTIE